MGTPDPGHMDDSVYMETLNLVTDAESFLVASKVAESPCINPNSLKP